jgi:hypothetical protein
MLSSINVVFFRYAIARFIDMQTPNFILVIGTLLISTMSMFSGPQRQSSSDTPLEENPNFYIDGLALI